MYKKCNNAIKILNDFKDAPWPQKSNPTATSHDDDNGTTTLTEMENETIVTDASESIFETDTIAKDDDDEAEEEEDYEIKSVKDEIGLKAHNDDANKSESGNDMDNLEIANGTVSFDSVDMDGQNEELDDGDGDVNMNGGGAYSTKTAPTINANESGENGATNNDLNNNKLNVIIEAVPSNEEMQEKSKEELSNTIMDTSTVLDDFTSDGELNNEKMHPAIKTALSCYCAVIQNDSATPKMVEIALECIGLLISNRYVVGSTLVTAKPSSGDDDGGNDDNDDEIANNKQSEVLYLIDCICGRADHVSDAVQAGTSKVLLALMTSPVCGVYEAGMLKAVRTVFHIYLVTKHDAVKKVTRAVLLDMLRSVFSRMEAYDAISTGDSRNSGEIPDIVHRQSRHDEQNQNTMFASRFHTDSYLLFRALCKLSAKLLPEDANDSSSVGSARKNIFASNAPVSDPMATNTKILSLRLILSVFENCGSAFRDGEKFIYAVQNFLCVSLVKNNMSNNPHVAHLSLKVFLMLVSHFLLGFIVKL